MHVGINYYEMTEIDICLLVARALLDDKQELLSRSLLDK
jgi:hypothetical protein